MDRRWASRKFALAAASTLAGVVFFALGKLDAGQWMDFTQWVLGLYLAANIGDTAVTKVPA